MDPLRFHFIDALDRRAAGLAGQLRRQLDARLSCLVQAYADDLAKSGTGTQAPPSPVAARSALGALLERCASRHAVQGAAADGGMPGPAAFPELPALETFRGIWSKVRTDSQLRQSLEPAPTDAGPLNSATLVHRAIALMRAASPGYLQHFVSYVDTLSGLEQLQHGGALPLQEAPMTESAARRARKKPRKPRG